LIFVITLIHVARVETVDFTRPQQTMSLYIALICIPASLALPAVGIVANVEHSEMLPEHGRLVSLIRG